MVFFLFTFLQFILFWVLKGDRGADGLSIPGPPGPPGPPGSMINLQDVRWLSHTRTHIQSTQRNTSQSVISTQTYKNRIDYMDCM